MSKALKRTAKLLLICICACTITLGLCAMDSYAATAAVKSVSNVSSGVKVSWSKDSSKSGYIIYRKVGSGSWTKVKKLSGSSKNSWTDTSTTNGKKYTYKVYTYKGSKTYSNSTTKYTYYVAKPSISNISSAQPGEFTVKTKSKSGTSGYKIIYSTKSSFSSPQSVTSSGAALNRIVGALKTGQKYFVKVQAYKKVNGKYYFSAASAYKSVTTMKAYNGYLTGISTPVYLTQEDSKAGENQTLLKYKYVVRVVRNIFASDKGCWYQLEYNGVKYVKWIGEGASLCDILTAGTPVVYDYVNSNNSEYQNAVIQLAMDIFNEGNTEYGHNHPQKHELNDNGKYDFDCIGFVKYVMYTALHEYDDSLNIYYTQPGTPKEFHDLEYLCNKGREGEVKIETVCEGTWDASKVKPGDVIFFDYSVVGKTALNHVGIYLGNGEFIHSAPNINGVGISLMSGKFATSTEKGGYFACVKRYIPEEFVPLDVTATAQKSLGIFSTVSDYPANKLLSLSSGDTVHFDYTTENKKGEEWAWVHYVHQGQEGEGYLKSPFGEGRLEIQDEE